MHNGLTSPTAIVSQRFAKMNGRSSARHAAGEAARMNVCLFAVPCAATSVASPATCTGHTTQSSPAKQAAQEQQGVCWEQWSSACVVPEPRGEACVAPWAGAGRASTSDVAGAWGPTQRDDGWQALPGTGQGPPGHQAARTSSATATTHRRRGGGTTVVPSTVGHQEQHMTTCITRVPHALLLLVAHHCTTPR